MSLFEERCVDGYLREKDTLLHATQEEKIRVIGDRCDYSLNNYKGQGKGNLAISIYTVY